MPKITAIKQGVPVGADWKTCILYHRLATGATLTELTFFASVSEGVDGFAVTNMGAVGQIPPGRNFTVAAIAFDPIAVAAVNDLELLEFQYGETRLERNNKIVFRGPTRAIGSIGGSTEGYVDKGSLGTTSALVFQGGALDLVTPEVYEELDTIGLYVRMAAAMSNTKNILASLLGWEVVEH